MRKILLVSLVILTGLTKTLYGQDKDFDIKSVPKEKNKIVYRGAIDVPGESKDSVYNMTIRSLRAIYKGFAGKIIKDDPATGEITFNGVMQGMVKDIAGDMINFARIKYILTFMARDGGVDYVLSDFTVEKGKKKPIESYYFDEPGAKLSKDDKENLFHSVQFEIDGNLKSLKRKLSK